MTALPEVSVEMMDDGRRFTVRTIDEIAKGVYGTVYRAASLPTESLSLFALKKSCGLMEMEFTQYASEVIALSRLQHPNIIKLLGMKVTPDESYLLFPLYETTLRDIITKGFDRTKHVKYAHDILAAVAYMHSQNVLHLDIKPENILCRADSLVLADFGWAHILPAEGARTTVQNLIPAAYRPPELYCPEDGFYSLTEVVLGSHADVWSVGLVILEIAHGEPILDIEEEEKIFKSEFYIKMQHTLSELRDIVQNDELFYLCVDMLHLSIPMRITADIALRNRVFDHYRHDLSATTAPSVPQPQALEDTILLPDIFDDICVKKRWNIHSPHSTHLWRYLLDYFLNHSSQLTKSEFILLLSACNVFSELSRNNEADVEDLSYWVIEYLGGELDETVDGAFSAALQAKVCECARMAFPLLALDTAVDSLQHHVGKHSQSSELKSLSGYLAALYIHRHDYSAFDYREIAKTAFYYAAKALHIEPLPEYTPATIFLPPQYLLESELAAAAYSEPYVYRKEEALELMLQTARGVVNRQ